MLKENGNNAESSTAGYQAPAVQKAFQILRIVAGSDKKLSLSELATDLGFSKSTAHGLVHALIREGALSQSAQGKKLLLGPTIIDLAFRGWNYLKIGRQVQPLLDKLRDTIGETVFLGVLSHENARAVIIASSEAAKPLKISSPTGTAISLLAGAAGKVFLAGMDDRETINLIREKGLPEFTPKSITREKDYLDELTRVREWGYATDHEEYLPGVKAVAVGLGNAQGLPLAVWVVGFASEMEATGMDRIISAAVRTAKNLGAALDENPD